MKTKTEDGCEVTTLIVALRPPFELVPGTSVKCMQVIDIKVDFSHELPLDNGLSGGEFEGCVDFNIDFDTAD